MSVPAGIHLKSECWTVQMNPSGSDGAGEHVLSRWNSLCEPADATGATAMIATIVPITASNRLIENMGRSPVNSQITEGDRVPWRSGDPARSAAVDRPSAPRRVAPAHGGRAHPGVAPPRGP